MIFSFEGVPIVGHEKQGPKEKGSKIGAPSGNDT